MTAYINLIDPQFVPRTVVPSAAQLAVAGIVAALALIAAGMIVRRQAAEIESQVQTQAARLAASRDRLAALGKTIAARHADAALVRQIEETETLVMIRREVVAAIGAGAAGSEQGFSTLMQALARQTLEGVWLTAVSVAAGGEQLTLSGRTMDPALLPVYLHKLNAEPAFRGRSFAELKMGEPKPAAGETKPAGGSGPAPWVEFRLAGRASEPGKR